MINSQRHKFVIARYLFIISLVAGIVVPPAPIRLVAASIEMSPALQLANMDTSQWQTFEDKSTGLSLLFPQDWHYEDDPTFLMSMSTSTSILGRRAAFGSYSDLLSGSANPQNGCHLDLYASLAPLDQLNSPALMMFPEDVHQQTGRNQHDLPRLDIAVGASEHGQFGYREVYLGYQNGVIGFIMWATDERILGQCQSEFAAIEDSLAVSGLGAAGDKDVLDILAAADVKNQPRMPRVLELPYRDTDVYIKQGWKYDFSNDPHNGIDYMKGSSGDSFDILAAASGSAQYLGYKEGWGNTVVIEHQIEGVRYYTLYAHLVGWDVVAAPEWKVVTVGDLIGVSGESGSGSGNAIHLHLETSTGTWGNSGYRYDPYDINGYAKLYPGRGSYTGLGVNHSWKIFPWTESYDGVILFEHSGYQGAHLVLTQDDLDLCDNPLDPSLGQIECFTAPSWTNNASSIKVSPGWHARLHKHNIADAEKWGDDESQGLTCDQDIDDFKNWTFPDGLTLDNEVSRIYVYKCSGGAGRASDIPVQSDPCQPSPAQNPSSDNAIATTSVSTYYNYQLQQEWYLRNTGTTTWGQGYKLAFTDGEKMGAPDTIDVPVTAPGAEAMLSMQFSVPRSAGEHIGYWQLRNPQGTYFGSKLSAKATVDNTPVQPPASDIQPIQLTCEDCPTSIGASQTFRPKIWVKVNQGELIPSRGDKLRNTDGNLYGANPDLAADMYIQTGMSLAFQFPASNPLRAPDTPGSYESRWRIWRNGGWDGPELVIRFEVTTSGGVNRPPNPPTLIVPSDWAVYTDNRGITLSAQQNGDPDNDAVTQYYFEIFGSALNANSGWINSNTWSAQGFGFNSYQWHAKVRDSRGAESGWSEQTRKFTIQTNQPAIYSFSSQTCRPTWGNTDQICFCAQTNAGTVRLQANTATDGSDRGTWHVFYEMGSSNINCNSDSDRPSAWMHLGYEAGRHLVRIYARRDGSWTAVSNYDTVIDLSANRRPNAPRILLPLKNSFVSSRTVLFDWIDTLRTTSYRLQVGTDNSLNNLLLDTMLPNSVSQYEHIFAQDYPQVYVRLTAIGPYGTNTYTEIVNFRIDRTPPTSSVASLPYVSHDSMIGVQWSGADSQSGLNWYHIQVRDGNRTNSQWVDLLVNTTKTAEFFTGLTGHTYYFRSRAMDKVGNWEPWPGGDGDAGTRIDPSVAPQVPWWNRAYQVKRNLVVLNNDTDTLPVHFPMLLHFDGATSPRADEIYAASLAGTKGNDLRIVYNNQTELNRIVYNFTPAAIDIWFPLAAGISGAQSDSSSYQLYIGNSAATNPPTDGNSVFLPNADGNTVGLWHFQEGAGGVVADSSGRGHNGSFPNGGWDSGLFGRAGVFNGSDSTVELGNHSDLDNLGAFTLEAWVRPSRSGGFGVVLKKGINGYDQYSMSFAWDNTIGCSVGTDSGNQRVFSTTRLQVGAWYHVACVHDGGSGFWAYVNGNEEGEKTDSHPAQQRNYPLYFGNAPYWDGTAFAGQIQHVRISNMARHDFPYAKIETLPSVAAGNTVAPPVEGSADLAVLNVTAYQDASDGHVVEAVVRNQGNLSTRNGFYTDLYVDHIPTGAGDYTGSVRFWVNSPIAAGEVLTLTSQPQNLADVKVTRANEEPAEITETLFLQTDTTGVVRETDKSNNITETGIEVCIAASDSYESDDNVANGALLTLGEAQNRNFNSAGDQDWVRFTANAGTAYAFTTGDLGLAADTYLHLYGTDAMTVLAANDDHADSLASRIEWKAPVTGTYFLLVRHWNPNAVGCGTTYSLSAAEVVPEVPTQIEQTISFSPIGTKTIGDPPFQIEATATSGLPVSLCTSTPEVCTVTGQTVTLVSPGICTLAAQQPGNELYFPAPDASQSFTVLPAESPTDVPTPAPTGIPSSSRVYLPSIARARLSANALAGGIAPDSQGGVANFSAVCP